MRPSSLQRSQYGLESDRVRGVQPWRQRVDYQTFRSEYGPDYKIGRHAFGVNSQKAMRLVSLAGGFAGVAGIFALFFFGGVPRVQKDILQKIPFVGKYFVHEVPPEDSPF